MAGGQIGKDLKEVTAGSSIGKNVAAGRIGKEVVIVVAMVAAMVGNGKTGNNLALAPATDHRRKNVAEIVVAGDVRLQIALTFADDVPRF